MTPAQFAVALRAQGAPWSDPNVPIVDLSDPKAAQIAIGRVHISAWSELRIAAFVVNVSGNPDAPIFITLATTKVSGLVIP